MLAAVIAHDKPGHLEVRKANRAAHLAYIESTGVVVMAGPLVEDGEMRGSLIVLDVADLAAAQAWVAGDPYGQAGLFATVTATEWRKVIG